MLAHFTDFQRITSHARDAVASAHDKDAAGNHIWPADTRSLFVEACFLKVFIGWESFLEKTFLDYMMGSTSLTGHSLTRYVDPLGLEHAKGFLLGGSRQQYTDWSTPETVRRMAKLCFHGGEPFETQLLVVHSDLLDLKTIRNAAAHMSNTTTKALDALASRKLQTVVTGYSPSRLLLAIDPTTTPPNTFLNGYFNLLATAAEAIVNV